RNRGGGGVSQLLRLAVELVERGCEGLIAGIDALPGCLQLLRIEKEHPKSRVLGARQRWPENKPPENRHEDKADHCQRPVHRQQLSIRTRRIGKAGLKDRKST